LFLWRREKIKWISLVEFRENIVSNSLEAGESLKRSSGATLISGRATKAIRLDSWKTKEKEIYE
jgi:hypothetical protein